MNKQMLSFENYFEGTITKNENEIVLALSSGQKFQLNVTEI